MKRSWFLFSMVLIVLLAACSAPQTAPASQNAPNIPAKPSSTGNVVSVSIKDFKFVPADVNIKVGDTVVWTNEDSVAHTVESSDGTLKSDELSQGDNYKHTFTQAGAYNYKCGIHPSMKGSVTVQ